MFFFFFLAVSRRHLAASLRSPQSGGLRVRDAMRAKTRQEFHGYQTWRLLSPLSLQFFGVGKKRYSIC